MTSPDHRGILSFDCASDGYLIAGGTELHTEEAHILYWDIRSSNKVIRTHNSTHSDDITNIIFLPHPNAETIISTSTDGLISSSNPLEDDEDEAVVNVANWGVSISKTGVFLSSGESSSIWAASDMETLSTWSLTVIYAWSLICNMSDHIPPYSWIPFMTFQISVYLALLSLSHIRHP